MSSWPHQRRGLWAIWALAFSALFTFALTPAQAQEAPLFNDAELQQMLAPVALYPDALLSQVLVAATYPEEVAQAQRWLAGNPARTGTAAINEAETFDWDQSVKSLLAFPGILQIMSAYPTWTQRLGQAASAQWPQVMRAVQALRHRAYAAGNLTSNNQVQIFLNADEISIVPANPEIIYLPYYNPILIYGGWWWPQYPPMSWAPMPAYGYHVEPGHYWGKGHIGALPGVGHSNGHEHDHDHDHAAPTSHARPAQPSQPIQPANTLRNKEPDLRPADPARPQPHETPEPCAKGDCTREKEHGRDQRGAEKSRSDR